MIEKIINKTKNAEDYGSFANLCLGTICQEVEASQGILYKVEAGKKPELKFIAGFACPAENGGADLAFELGEGLPGQVAMDGQIMKTDAIPEGYIVISGLGQASPKSLLLYPFKNEMDEVIAVLEIASFKDFNDEAIALLNNLNTFVVDSLNLWQ
jgi:hypothetical protein